MRHRSISQADIVSLLAEYQTAAPKETAIDAPVPARSAEAEELLAALEACRWNRDETARMLGISRSTLWRKMNRFGIQKRKPHLTGQ